MLSPTTAMIAKSFSTIKGSILWSEISFSKALSIDVLAFDASFSAMPIQIECSDDACVIKMTLIFSCDKPLITKISSLVDRLSKISFKILSSIKKVKKIKPKFKTTHKTSPVKSKIIDNENTN